MHPRFPAFALGVVLALPAGATQLVKNINNLPQIASGFPIDSSPQGFTEIGTRLYFSANTGATGREYFFAEGNGGPVGLWADVLPGNFSSSPDEILGLPNGRLIFTAQTATGVRALWSSDGTATGLQQVVPTSGPGGLSAPKDLVLFQGACYFLARPVGATSLSLWRTDGTASGTVELDSLNLVGPYSPAAQMLVSAGNRLYYTASEGLAIPFAPTQGVWRLYTSDGTQGGSSLLKQFDESSPLGVDFLGPRELTAVGTRVVMRGDSLLNGRELVVSDGTVAGTSLVDLIPGPQASFPTEFKVVGNVVLFAANDTLTSGELFASDGTPSGTYQVTNAFPDASRPAFLSTIGTRVAFNVDDGVHGKELWTATAVPGSARLYADFNPGPLGSDPSFMAPVNGGIVCQAKLPATGSELFFSNGTPAGTTLLKDIFKGSGSGNPQELTVFGNRVVFKALDPLGGLEPWVTNGTSAGTLPLADLATSPFDGASVANSFARLGPVTVFAANDGFSGRELWATNGTAGGTTRLTNFKGAEGSLKDGPVEMVVYRDRAYFPLNDGIHGMELWSSDGTAAGTRLVIDLNPEPVNTNPRPLLAWKGELYFAARTPVSGNINIFATDGTSGGTRQVTNFPGPFSGYDSVKVPVEHAGRLYFDGATPTMGTQLWSTDGTQAGTVQISGLTPSTSIQVGAFGGLSAGSLGSFLYFQGGNDIELYRTDGTPAGTSLFANLDPATNKSSFPSGFQRIGNRLVFRAFLAGQYQYFSTDGSSVVQLTAPPYSASGDVGPTNNKLIGMLRGPGGSSHLFGTDGTLSGSGIIADIAPAGSNFVEFTPWRVSSGNKLLFAASNPAVGSEIFITDGLTAGPLSDLAPGPADSSPEDVLRVGDRLIFGAKDPLLGNELYSLPFSLVGDYVSEPYGQGCFGSNGLEPKISATGAVVPGGSLTIDVTNTPPFAPLVHYWSSAFGLLQLGKCSIYLSPLTFLTSQGANGSGSATLPITIPNNPSLVGKGLWLQSLVIDPGAELLGLAALTAALELRF